MSTKNLSEDVWLAEYNTLRLELLEITKARYLILTVAIGAMGIVSGLVTDTESPQTVLLIPIIGFVLIAPFAYITYILSQHYHRLTAYLEVFVEPQIGLKREKVWNIYHKKFQPNAFTRPLMMTYAMLILVSSFFPLVFIIVSTDISKFSSNHIIIAGIEVIAGIVIGVYIGHNWVSAHVRHDVKKKWIEVQKTMAKE